jgi:hypothetical protein
MIVYIILKSLDILLKGESARAGTAKVSGWWVRVSICHHACYTIVMLRIGFTACPLRMSDESVFRAYD